MSYSVRWSRRALDALAQTWLDESGQRAAITQAAATTDQLLHFDPGQQGEERDKDRRVVFVPPLVVTFSLDESHRIVRVLNVRFLKRRGSS